MVDNLPANISKEIIDLSDYRYNFGKRQTVEELLEPVAGDMVIGQLPPALIVAFVETQHLAFKLEEYVSHIRDKIADRTKTVARAQLDGEKWDDLVRIAGELPLFDSDEEAGEYFHALASYEAKHKELVLEIRMLTSNFIYGYDIRQDFKVVRLAKRF
jgi:hypothetical protein